MGIEEATEAKVPYIGEVELTNPVALVTFVLSLVAGMTIWNMADSIGANLASTVNSKLGNVLGQNPATGQQTNDAGGAFE